MVLCLLRLYVGYKYYTQIYKWKKWFLPFRIHSFGILGSWFLTPKQGVFLECHQGVRTGVSLLSQGIASSPACGTVFIVSRKPFRRFETEMMKSHESNCHSLGGFFEVDISSNAKNWKWTKWNTQWRVSNVTTNSWKMLPLFKVFFAPVQSRYSHL